MIVVADTSVILNLCRVQHENLLRQLFNRVLIPTTVALEFARLANAHKRFSGLILPEWVEVLAHRDRFLSRLFKPILTQVRPPPSHYRESKRQTLY